MVKYASTRRPVFCMNCAHEFISQVINPHCSKCGSSQVVDSKEVSFDQSATRLRTELKKIIIDLKATDINQLRNGYFRLDEIVGQIGEAFKVSADKIKDLESRVIELERKPR